MDRDFPPLIPRSVTHPSWTEIRALMVLAGDKWDHCLCYDPPRFKWDPGCVQHGTIGWQRSCSQEYHPLDTWGSGPKSTLPRTYALALVRDRLEQYFVSYRHVYVCVCMCVYLGKVRYE